MIFQEIKRIAELQKSYSSNNSPEMRERGILIRKHLPESLEPYLSEFKECLSGFGEDIYVDASDGIGRKTEAPWVRICSKSMSPTARDGFYVVFHFSADGERAYVTVGCGSTIWEKGDLKAVSSQELAARTDWARQVLRNRELDFSEFADDIHLNAKAPLPKTFEQATVFARSFEAENVEIDSFIESTKRALVLLVAIYEAQSQGKHLTNFQMLEADIDGISRPPNSARGRQGYGLTADERKTVEERAMDVAGDYLNSLGYKIKDESKKKPYDFEAVKAGQRLKVEVKGTTSKDVKSILMTRNEVNLHRAEKGSTALIIVFDINLKRNGSDPEAYGGTLEAFLNWDIDEWKMSPIAYEVTRKAQK